MVSGGSSPLTPKTSRPLEVEGGKQKAGGDRSGL
jgi:hypothetical protein